LLRQSDLLQPLVMGLLRQITGADIRRETQLG
jgi:hypothetical protein